MAKQDKMIEAVRAKSDAKLQYLKETVDEMVSKGIAVTAYSVGMKTGLSKTFLYGNEEAKAYIEKHRSPEQYNQSKYDKDGDLQKQVKTLKKEKNYSQKLMAKVNAELYDELLEENKRLKAIISKYEKLVKMGLLQIPEDMKI